MQNHKAITNDNDLFYSRSSLFIMPQIIKHTVDFILKQFNQMETKRYTRLRSRLNSFDKAPIQLKCQKSLFARVGSFYTSIADEVKCAKCKIIISNWITIDNPSKLHALWSPRCTAVTYEANPRHSLAHVLLKRGNQFSSANYFQAALLLAAVFHNHCQTSR